MTTCFWKSSIRVCHRTPFQTLGRKNIYDILSQRNAYDVLPDSQKWPVFNINFPLELVFQSLRRQGLLVLLGSPCRDCRGNDLELADGNVRGSDHEQRSADLSESTGCRPARV